MTRTLRLFAAACLALASHTAFAEGRCPPGMYPIDAPGVSACAPIPGYYAQPAPPPQGYVPRELIPRPTGAIAMPAMPRFNGPFGALAVDLDRPSMHTYGDKAMSPEDADKLALLACKENGANRCSIRFRYANECVAIGWPKSQLAAKGEPTTAFYATGPTEAAAIRKVKDTCAAASGEACSEGWTGCSFLEQL